MIHKLHSLVEICSALNLSPNKDDTTVDCASITSGSIINILIKPRTELTSAFFDNLDLLASKHKINLYSTERDLLNPTEPRKLDSSKERLSKIKASFSIYAEGLINDSKQEKLDFKTAYKYLNYSPETGKISWKLDINPMVPEGTSGGFKHSSGQHIIKINGEVYRLNRVIWLLQTGAWPKGRIKHKDSNLNNLRWENLYEEKAEK
jgi:HNH endonuclease